MIWRRRKRFPWLGRPARALLRSASERIDRARRPSHGKIAVLAVIALLASFSAAQYRPAATTSSSSAPADVRFQTIDVTIDPKGQPLAAYQLEFVADANRVKLVGVEGGDHAAFREPPYYDPAALSHHRVILAAFNTSADLPRTSVRVARLHVQVSGDGQPQWTAKLIVASSDTSDSIPADVRVSEGAQP